ncbi:GNAT family N-acetyltransferase [Cronobacter malonaticus]
MKIDFSALTDTHITACAHLYCKVYKEAPWFEKSELEPVIAFIREHLNNNYFRGYIARHDDNIVAVSIGFRKPWPGGVEYYIDEFFVDPDYQGKGVGSALMNFIADRSLHEGLNAMILNTHKAYPSDFFYRKNGFDEHRGLIILSRTLE